MNNESIRELVTGLQPGAVFDETGEWLVAHAEASDFKTLARTLQSSGFDYLFCITCIDWKTHLTMVYHFSSTIFRTTFVVKCRLERDAATIDTVSDIWRTAEFHEREVYELFGVHFNGHPDLRRLILTDDFVGFPLRKDFEDPVNMIRL